MILRTVSTADEFHEVGGFPRAMAIICNLNIVDDFLELYL
jgi:hypothetical protein